MLGPYCGRCGKHVSVPKEPIKLKPGQVQILEQCYSDQDRCYNISFKLDSGETLALKINDYMLAAIDKGRTHLGLYVDIIK